MTQDKLYTSVIIWNIYTVNTYVNISPSATAFSCTFWGVLLLLSFLTQWTKLSQILHEDYSALEAFSIIKQVKSDIPRLYAIFQLKLCLSTKIKPIILSKFLGCFVFAPIFKAKVESFSNFRFCILTQMIMFHYIMDDV